MSYEGNLLSFEYYGIENPKDCMDCTTKTQVLNMTVFYSLIFLQETAITSGSDGYLYLWQDKKIIKKQNAHPKAAILSLFTSKNSKIFVSGAVDGKAIVWQVSSNSIFQKKNEFCIYSGKDSILLPKYQIQSAVFIGKNELTKNRPLMENESPLLLVENRRTNNIRRKNVTGELNAVEIQAEGLRDGL